MLRIQSYFWRRKEKRREEKKEKAVSFSLPIALNFFGFPFDGTAGGMPAVCHSHGGMILVAIQMGLSKT